MASPTPTTNQTQSLHGMQRAAEDAAEALRRVCTVLNEIALDMTFAKHADRMPLRLSSDRIENISRTLIGEVTACCPVGATHASIIGKVALAAARVSVLPFAEETGHASMQRFEASHERAMRNLEWVQQYAESARSETRRDLRPQITALLGELDRLAATVGVELGLWRRELDEALDAAQLPARSALEGLEQVFAQVRMGAQKASSDETQGSFFGSASAHLNRLAEIEFTIAEIFAQLTGDSS